MIRIERYYSERMEVFVERRRVIAWLLLLQPEVPELHHERLVELTAMSDMELAIALGEQLDNAPEEILEMVALTMQVKGDQEIIADQWNCGVRS